MTSMRDAALDYAARGWPVFPIKPRGKEPLTEHGFLDATADPEQVTGWWTRWPEANIGAACGHAFDVLDVDEPGGSTVLLDMLAEHGHPRDAPRDWTARARTGGGGGHYFFQPGGPVRWRGFRPHLDWLGLRGYVILPPSIHPSGVPYLWQEGPYTADRPPEAFPPAPAWLHAAVTRPIREIRPPRDPGGDPEGRPGADFNRRMPWGELLEADGARLERTQGDVAYWTRPGKARGISASVGGGGHDLLYVFSGNWPKLDADTSYSKFAYWAATRHGGDFAAAAKDLAAHGYGDQSAESDQSSEASGLWSPTSLRSQANGAVEAWPVLDPAALHGLAGRLVATLRPHTEADDVALLLSFLAAFGNATGPGPRALVGATEHPARLNVLLVGQTARARKGTAQAEVGKVLALADPGWFAERVMGGLASGEGLIAAVRDPAADDDGGAPVDKRLLCVEAEFARVLGVAAREGNTLSAVLRQAWDDGRLRTMTRKDPLRASGAHISIVGHITAEELLRRLGDTEIANGFANRFLLALVRRSKKLPEGGQLDPAALDDLAADVMDALDRARRVGVLRRSEVARELWAKAYADFGDGAAGLAGALTARPEAQTLRLSVTYALLDGSAAIDPPHIEAALAVWRYCEASATAIFGSLLGDPIADRLLVAIREAGSEGLDGTEQRDLFGRHAGGGRLAMARALLEGKRLIVTSSEETGGRPRLVSRAVTR